MYNVDLNRSYHYGVENTSHYVFLSGSYILIACSCLSTCPSALCILWNHCLLGSISSAQLFSFLPRIIVIWATSQKALLLLGQWLWIRLHILVVLMIELILIKVHGYCSLEPVLGGHARLFWLGWKMLELAPQIRLPWCFEHGQHFEVTLIGKIQVIHLSSDKFIFMMKFCRTWVRNSIGRISVTHLDSPIWSKKKKSDFFHQ